MAKPVIVRHNGSDSAFEIRKLDRAKLYGRRRRQVLDSAGNPCARAELTRDGALLIRSGMTAIAYFDPSGTWIPNKQLVGLDHDGTQVDKVPSTLGVAQGLEGPVEPGEVLNLALRSVYILTPDSLADDLKAALDDGGVFRFSFNYRADYNAETAYLVANDNGYFALIGNPTESPWCEFETAAHEDFSDDADDDELDFEMF